MGTDAVWLNPEIAGFKGQGYGLGMSNMVFNVERLNPPETGLGFSGRWTVVCRESGQPDRSVGAYLTSAEAEAAAQRLRRDAAKDA